MPLYEYQCPRCGRFELIQKFSDSPLASCPTCGSEVQKLLSAPAIQFKGTGWYITDYARKSVGAEGAAKSKDGTSPATETASASKESSADTSSAAAKTSSASGKGSAK